MWTNCIKWIFTMHLFSAFLFESTTVSSETWIFYKWSIEITFNINQPFLKFFSIYITDISLLQCLIAILWLQLKHVQSCFCIFKNIRNNACFVFFFLILSYLHSGKDLLWQHDQNPQGYESCPLNSA